MTVRLRSPTCQTSGILRVPEVLGYIAEKPRGGNSICASAASCATLSSGRRQSTELSRCLTFSRTFRQLENSARMLCVQGRVAALRQLPPRYMTGENNGIGVVTRRLTFSELVAGSQYP